MIFKIGNCIDKMEYPNYFLLNNSLYPCSLFNKNCYVCDAALIKFYNNICLSCNPGFKFNENTKGCQTYNENEYPITVENFDNCKNSYSQNYELYTTYCEPLENEKHEKECEKNNYIYNNGTHLISNKSYKILFINWLEDCPNCLTFPSYNDDKSGYLLIELTSNGNSHINVRRKMIFFNEEGRGLFNEINDKYECYAEHERAYLRFLSSSIDLKLNSTGEYRYFLNFENFNNNLELLI